MKAPLPRVLLLCNGESPSRGLIRRLARGADMFVAADGGANAALSAGVRPDVIIGDLDSIRPAARRKFSGSRIIRVRRQDNTDLEKALDFIASSGQAEVVIAGAVGGRIDHTLGNLSVFWNYTRKLTMTIAGDGWRAFPAGRQATLTAPRGTTVSLVPFGTCSGITLRGLRYPLTNAVMRPGEIGVSNVVRRSPFTVSVRRGRMLIIVFDRSRGPGGTRPW
ncbi:MAG TPA: thiamine diphosphokinase [Bacteroidota bacterium]|nr:thiamine diphosphokinase [Bacteroidota bacterium]